MNEIVAVLGEHQVHPPDTSDLARPLQTIVQAAADKAKAEVQAAEDRARAEADSARARRSPR